MMRNVRSRAALVLVLSAEAGGVVALARLGARQPFDLPLDDVEPWLRAAPADALAAALRLVGLASGGWVLLATLLSVITRAAHLTRATDVCAALTPRALRRVVDRALATSVVLAAVASPAGARVRSGVANVGVTSDPAVVLEIRDGRRVDAPTETPPVSPPPVAPAAPAVGPAASAPGTVVVAPGDNLWELSARALATATGRGRASLDDAAIARYWLLVCGTNRDLLRSGDVNLVFSGEVVILPPVDGAVS
jgi:hypothetical protein